jgi:hypothetical protein
VVLLLAVTSRTFNSRIFQESSMQKKLIALAIAGLLSGAAFAQSNVTVYGISRWYLSMSLTPAAPSGCASAKVPPATAAFTSNASRSRLQGHGKTRQWSGCHSSSFESQCRPRPVDWHNRAFRIPPVTASSASKANLVPSNWGFFSGPNRSPFLPSSIP